MKRPAVGGASRAVLDEGAVPDTPLPVGAGSGLSLLAAALVGVIAWQLAASEAEPPPRVVAPRPAPATAPEPPAHPDAPARAEAALARPLFRPDRRPTLPAAEPPPRAAEDPPRLTALLSGPFGRRAIFAEANGRSTVVGEGGAMGEWTVLSIGADVVAVTGRDGERVVRLAYGGGVTAAAIPPLPPPLPDEHGAGELLRLPAAGPVAPPAAGPLPFGRR